MISTTSTPVPELEGLGEHVVAARKRRSLSQIALARRCGLSQAAISAIESGNRRPSLDQFFRIARALEIPIQRLIDGSDSPGWQLPDIAMQLRSLGIADLRVRDAKVPGAFLRTEEVIAHAVSSDAPDPRIITAMPAVLAWNEWDDLLMLKSGSNRVSGRSSVWGRVVWLADIAHAIHQRRGFPGGCYSHQLSSLLRHGGPPKTRGVWDSLGHPMSEEPRSPIWRRWRINFDADIKEFEQRAEQLVELGGGLR